MLCNRWTQSSLKVEVANSGQVDVPRLVTVTDVGLDASIRLRDTTLSLLMLLVWLEMLPPSSDSLFAGVGGGGKDERKRRRWW